MRNNRKKYCIIAMLLVIELITIFLTYKSGSNKFAKEKVKRNGPTYAIMLKENGTEKYTEYTEKNSWPTSGYKYNEELSNCIDIDGNTIEGIMSFDNDTRIATVKSKKEAYCYLYFDYDPIPTNFKFDITAMKVETNKKYTNKETNPVTISWVDDDVKAYCIFEEKVERGIKASTNVMDYCKWTPVSEQERKNGKVSINYTLKTKTNEERIISAYIKDEAGSVVGGTDKITFDNVGPNITFKNNNNNKVNGWYQTMTVQIKANDGVGIGIDNVKYCVGAENCTVNKPVNNGLANVVMTTAANEQRIRVLGVDKLGNTNEVWASEKYKVDTSDPTISFELGTRQEGEGGWYKSLKIKVIGGDVGSGISTIKYCTGESECTPNKTINNNTENVIPNGAKPQKLCATITDKAGRVKTSCTALYNVDGLAPVCGTVKKTVINTTAGVSGTVGCSDTFSGCTNNTFNFSGIKTTNSVQIKDKAGNVSNCVQISTKIQKNSQSCNSGKRCAAAGCASGYWTNPSWCSCTSSCTNWRCPANLSGLQDGHEVDMGCRASRPYSGCYSTGTTCLAHSYCNYVCTENKTSASACGCASWSSWTGWKDVSSCTYVDSNTSQVRCQTLYS